MHLYSYRQPPAGQSGGSLRGILSLRRGEPRRWPDVDNLQGMLGVRADRGIFARAELVLGEAVQRLVLGSARLIGNEPVAALMPDLADRIALARPEPMYRRELRHQRGN